MQIYSVKEKLPRHGQYVLAHFPHRPWLDEDAKGLEHKWVVVKFERGLSMADRAEMSSRNPRKRAYYQADEHGNNAVPYAWRPFGPGSFFGQEAALWCELPSYEVVPKAR